MVVIVKRLRTSPLPADGSTTVYSPYVEIHKIERAVHGNGIDVKVYGEMLIAAGEQVWARELYLNTLEVLVLTPEIYQNNGLGYMAQKSIYFKGMYDNYASIDIYDDASVWQTPGTGPVAGSIWLNFIAEGE